jgi:hypothetical protein
MHHGTAGNRRTFARIPPGTRHAVGNGFGTCAFLRVTGTRLLRFGLAAPRACVQVGREGVGALLRYFAERTPIPRFYQVHRGERHYSTGTITVLPFVQLCEELQLP